MPGSNVSIIPVAHLARLIAVHLIKRWTWTLLSRVPCNHQTSVLGGKFQQWGACLIITNGQQHKKEPPTSHVCSCYEISGLTENLTWVAPSTGAVRPSARNNQRWRWQHDHGLLGCYPTVSTV
jgi:hypothetical protein